MKIFSISHMHQHHQERSMKGPNSTFYMSLLRERAFLMYVIQLRSWRNARKLSSRNLVNSVKTPPHLHLCPGGRDTLGVVRPDVPLRHLVEALLDDLERLPHLGHAAQVAVVAVALPTHRDVKVHQIVGVVWLHLHKTHVLILKLPLIQS